MKNEKFKLRLKKGVGGMLIVCALLNPPYCAEHEKEPTPIVDQYNLDDVAKLQNQFDVLVNKNNPIAQEEIDLIKLVPTKDVNGNTVYLQEDALNAFNALQKALKQRKENTTIAITSGFRTLAEQKETYDELKNEYGEDYANQYVAPVGCSEHHTGLAIDVYFDRWDFLNSGFLLQFNVKYQNTKKETYKLMTDYGFILRYTEENKDITGYPAEDWHIRYVGVELAQFLTQHNLTLEEYHEAIKQYQEKQQSEVEEENVG